MPTRKTKGTSLHYTITGSGPETLFFSHGLLFHAGMWEAQVAAFSGSYRCVTYDHRGQGQSGREGDRSMDTLAEDAIALMEDLELGPVHFVGFSMGGFVAQRVAARRPDLVRSLVLLDTSAEPEAKPMQYALLNTAVKLFGVGPIKGRVLPILFGRSTLEDPAQAGMVAQWTTWLSALPKDITAAVKGVIERDSVEEEITAIACPTLVVVGEEDVATVPAKSQRIAALIPGAKLAFLRRCGHMSPLEDPEGVNAALTEFWNEL